MTPAWILDIFAAIMLVVAAVSAARLVAARPWQRGAVITDTDISHLLMGIAMAGMLAPSLTTLPNDAWAVVFGVLAVWFGYRVVRDYQASGARALAVGHCAPHLVHSAAMLYMFARDHGARRERRLGHGRHGRDERHVHAARSDPGVRLRAHPDRVHDLGPRPAVQPPARPRRGGRRGGNPALAGASAGTVGTGAVAGSGAGGGVAADPPAGSGEAGHGGTAGGGRSGVMAILDSPGTVVGCRIAMGVTMALMLILMI